MISISMNPKPDLRVSRLIRLVPPKVLACAISAQRISLAATLIL
jgi:hypothetical protein